MKLRCRFFAGAVALAMGGTMAPQPAAAASTNAEFRAAVARVLDSIKDSNDYLSGLSSAEYKAFLACAQNVMDSAPRPRKEYVLAASNMSEQRRRFDQVALDNRAALKQRITLECS